MNRIKRISSIILAIVLSLGMAFRLDISHVFAEKENNVGKQVITLLSAEEEAKTLTIANASDFIYMDLAAGDITIGKSTYTGFIFVNGTSTKVEGTHYTENKYYIYQSNLTKTDSPCYFTKTGYTSDTEKTNKTNLRIPQFSRVKYTGNGENKTWSDYITNNTNVKQVSMDWDVYAPNSGRDSTTNRITFSAGATYHTTIDNIWCTYHQENAARTTGGITAHLGRNENTDIQIKLKGDSRFGNVHYHSYEKKNNKIVFSNGDLESAPGSITVADFKTKTWSTNHWCAAIGGNDSGADKSDGIVIDSGVVYAGTTPDDNCTAIGGGGNEYGGVTINGGKVTAVAATTGTAIGGGIGWGSKGGNTDITISDGEVYAYNFGIDNSSSDKFKHYVPAVAIGGGSSQGNRGNEKTIVNISGGFVYAQCMGGAAIGGGGSATQLGGDATINITGGTIIAKSTEGEFKGTDDPETVKISAGVSIGGGTGATGGGSVKLNIDGGILRTGSVGGGKTTGSGTIGSANVTITDGDIIGQIVMAGGASEACTFTMSGGVIHDVDLINGNKITDLNDPQPGIPISYIEKNGGAVCMDDTKGITEISGGIIQNCSAELGGAVYMSGGAFTISETGAVEKNKATMDGGGVYVGGGNVKVTGGSISNNTAERNGGGAYVAGDFSMTAGDIISNKATNGGGIYVNDGVVTMYGGRVDSNTAIESGGGIHISSTEKDALVDIFSGSISGNKAKSGGGVSVVSTSDKNINVTVGVNCVHPNLNEGVYTPFAYTSDCGEAHNGHTNHISGLTHSSCPKVENNTALDNGGGFFLKSAKTKLIFYCIIEDGNVADGKLQCYDMDVQGGHVEIGDKTYNYEGSDPVKGNIIMQDSIWVEGGTVDIYGTMSNPQFTDDITVEITKENEYYADHRKDPKDSATGELQHYKVHYYENFKGADGITTGSYIARDYPDEEHKNNTDNDRFYFTIMSSIFSRPGFKIVGWNSKPDGKGDTYNVNDTYNLAELNKAHKVGASNSKGEYDESLLVLYAIWKRDGYVIEFNPNVGDGQTYTGTMQNQSVTVGLLDGSQTINKNQFKRQGYMFLGWTLTPTPTATDAVYEDGQKIITDFTKDDGATIVLYAKWDICNHLNYLTYVANENVLTEGCSNCGGHSATATITALNSVYDGNEHLATVKYSVSWLGGELEILYKMAANTEWDSKDTVDDNWTENSVPLHAGSYTASITVQETTAEGVKKTTAKTEYVISQVQWATPEIPVIEFSVSGGQNVITITKPVQDGLIRFWKTDSDAPIPADAEWLENNRFEGLPLGFYYYFYAKKCADRDHSESAYSKSEAFLADGGNIVYLDKQAGIKIVPTIGEGKFVYTVGADTGYHLRNYSDNFDTALDNVKTVPGAEELAQGKEGITLNKEPLADGTYKYTVTFSKDTSYQIVTLEFSGAAKNASVVYKVTDGQVFSDFNGGDIEISRDSAFTAQFTVKDYIADEYTNQVLNFSKGLPLGTTIILKFNDKYWYCKLGTDAVTAVDLTSFIAMGKNNEVFIVDTTSATPTTFTYQFIVDFSKTENTMTESLQVTLSLVADTAKNEVPNIPSEGVTHVSLGIKEEATFALESSVNGDLATIKGTYTQSLGKASIWNGRNTALVLTAPETIPADSRLTAVLQGATTRYTMNSDKQFIIPLGEVGNKELNITLSSSMLSSTEEIFAFTAKWYVSESSVDNSPLNGKMVAECDVDFTCKNTIPSVRIDGTNHIYKAGEVLEITVNFKGIPNGATITAYLQGKTEGKYVDTGDKREITNDPTIGKQTIRFNMGQMNKGSYRILVIVQDYGANILQVPYYFVIV